MPRPKNEGLTDREWEVAEGVWEEKTAQQIAEELGISDRTVETHVGHIKDKLGVDSLVGIALHVERNRDD